MAAYAALVSVMQILHQIENHPSPPISLDKKQVESLTEIVTFLQEFLEGYNSPFADSNKADPLEMRIADAAYAAEDVIESHIVDNIKLVAETTHGNDDDDDYADSNEADPLEMRIADAAPKSRWKKWGFFNCFRKPKNDGKMHNNLLRSVSNLNIAAETTHDDDDYDNDAESNIVDNIKLVAQTSDDNESNIVDRILPAGSESQKEPKNDGEKINNVLYEGLKKVIEDMDLIKKEVMEIVAEKEVVQDQLQRQVTTASASLTRLNSTMVGFDEVRLEIMDKLTSEERYRQVIPIVGMGGIGKTTLAKNIYAQPLIKDRFDICAWTTISQKYNTKQILSDLFSQVNKQGSEDELELALYKYLYGRRFLIVLDDMWSIEAWEEMQRYLPDNGNCSRILVTTRLLNLGSQLDNNYSLEMKFLDEVSSWGMFSEIVFKGDSCPLELEEIGKKIVESCRGLPLSIVVIGGLLEKLERTKKCWESIRRNLNSLVNSENDDHCLKILKMSYNHLPVYLKPCFLYMGVFEEDSAIRVSTVVKLWVSEGFLKPISEESLETTAKRYIKELVDRNLILVDKLGFSGSVKFCKIHDLLRDLCLRESQKERFYHVVGQQSPRRTSRERCIVIPRGSSKEKVLNAIESTPYARSCIKDDIEGSQLLPNLRLLRILKVADRDRYRGQRYSIDELFQLVNLRFLVVEAHPSAPLPSSINLLWSLQTIIVVHPVEIDARVVIWKMPQLRHVEFHGLRLPDPPRDNIVIMENLQTLTGVLDLQFDELVVQRIPNIKKLGLILNLHNMECLHKLESLSCTYSEYISFPRSLKKLRLWMKGSNLEDMFVKIGSLPLLEKLILEGGWFSFRTWEVVEGQFPSLKFLSLKRVLDLEIWTTESSPFPCLEHLHLQELDQLKEIPTEIGEIPTLKSIVLEYCSTSAVKSMKKIVEEQQELQEDDLPFKVQVFLFDKNEEVQKLANPNFLVNIGFFYRPRPYL